MIDALAAAPSPSNAYAVADHTHDWTRYPYTDLAVRKWAQAETPGLEWPDDEKTFGEWWRTVTGDQLGLITLYTLAWGAHQTDRS